MVEGVDGAGKSTLVGPMARTLANRGIPVLLIDKATRSVDADEPLSRRVEAINDVVYGMNRGPAEEWGDHHWLFLLAAWYSLLDKCIVRPSLASGRNILMDNGFYKILARYWANSEFPHQILPFIFENLTEPDLVIYLDVSPEMALKRRPDFTALESGFSGGSSEGFVQHQETLRTILREFADRYGWAAIDTTRKNPTEVLTAALNATIPLFASEWGQVQVSS